MENIYNFLQISNSIATSGQPTKEEFTLIKEAGYQVVVNPNEKRIVESQGMEYVNIPVIWEKPTLENVKDFFSSYGDKHQ